GMDYYINHVNKTTTYHNPRKDYAHEDPPPAPREVILERDHELGFGFVAGSERPVIVRFVTEGGPSEDRLLPGDEIIAINGQDVKTAPREHVIDMVKSCQSTVTLIVCQPVTNNTTKKSALLTAAKKAKLRNRPSKVRFAEGVVINGSPLYGSELEGAPVANVIKVFLENGHTKSFKYDNATDVQSVLDVLKEKVCISDGATDLFGLVIEQLKTVGGRRNKISLLDPRETLGKIAALPGSHNLRCLFRVALLPLDPYELLQSCPHSFEYLYQQCCNDLVNDKVTPPLEAHVALRLSSLHLHQHLLSQGLPAKPSSIKQIEEECGLTRFVSFPLLVSMKRKQLRKIFAQFMKQNEGLCSPGQKQLTPLQVKLHFLKIMSEQEGYGCRILEPVAECEGSSFLHGEYLLLSGRGGLRKFHGPPSQHLLPHLHAQLQGQPPPLTPTTSAGQNHHPSPINIDKVHPPTKNAGGASMVAVEERSDGTVALTNSAGQPANGQHSSQFQQITELVKIENISKISITKEDEFTYIVNITPTNIVIGMEERPMLELILLLRGYYQLLKKEELFVEWLTINPWEVETAPVYHGTHVVVTREWSYCPPLEDDGAPNGLRKMDYSTPPPPYVPNESLLSEFRSISRSSSTTGSQRNLDFNMNLANRFELSVEATHANPAVAKPVETINHRVVARQLERAYSSPTQTSLAGLRASPVQFTLGGDDDVLMGLPSSATPDLLGHVMHPAMMLGNRQLDDVSSINESTSSGEAN
ncbi:FERM and PDZ domain-containing protein 4-like, partial [Tropilaelaps mercedesae]